MILDRQRLLVAVKSEIHDKDVLETVEDLIQKSEETESELEWVRKDLDSEVLRADKLELDRDDLSSKANELSDSLEKARDFYRDVKKRWKGPWPKEWSK